MFKKLIPVIMLVFVTACANVQGSSEQSTTSCKCCENCQCSKSGKECCKDGDCRCKNGDCSCHDRGICKMHQGKVKGSSSVKEGKPCQDCLESEKQ